jgi:pyruvate/2-oxoglutarate dehydrogenase complex dihydrolipoamide dehydrogenase (E3) component
MTERADVVVVGLGVGGEEVAGRLAETGLSVVGIERSLVGGECPYWGCVPSKMMIRAANLLAEARRIPGMAGAAEVRPDWAPVARRIRDEATDSWDDRVAVERFTGKGGRFVRGDARFVGPREVAVGDRTFQAKRGVVIATGTAPAIPPIEGLAGTPLWTNHEAIEADTLPGSLVVLGGGAIGLELAQVFARFGVEVTVLEALDRLLAVEEPEASELAAKALARDGVSIRTGVSARAVEYGKEFTLQLEDGTSVTGDKLLVATGRRAALGGLNLAAAGLDPDARSIAVDELMRAGDRIWAVGDVTGRGAFTHVAMYQATIAVRDILLQDGPPATTARCRGSRSPTPRSARSGSPNGRPASRACAWRPARQRCRPRPAAGSTRPATRASSSWWSTPTGACWWAPHRPVRPAARCSRRWRWRCTPRCRWRSSAT